MNWNCPKCGTNNSNIICVYCGFDDSKDYEHYEIINPLFLKEMLDSSIDNHNTVGKSQDKDQVQQSSFSENNPQEKEILLRKEICKYKLNAIEKDYAIDKDTKNMKLRKMCDIMASVCSRGLEEGEDHYYFNISCPENDIELTAEGSDLIESTFKLTSGLDDPKYSEIKRYLIDAINKKELQWYILEPVDSLINTIIMLEKGTYKQYLQDEWKKARAEFKKANPWIDKLAEMMPNLKKIHSASTINQIVQTTFHNELSPEQIEKLNAKTIADQWTGGNKNIILYLNGIIFAAGFPPIL